ncbi:hypothetical protein [Pseudomonas phage REC1]|nr:hypothetical protein [Pseudomonas phage REC1]
MAILMKLSVLLMAGWRSGNAASFDLVMSRFDPYTGRQTLKET